MSHMYSVKLRFLFQRNPPSIWRDIAEFSTEENLLVHRRVFENEHFKIIKNFIPAKTTINASRVSAVLLNELSNEAAEQTQTSPTQTQWLHFKDSWVAKRRKLKTIIIASRPGKKICKVEHISLKCAHRVGCTPVQTNIQHR